MSARDLEVSIAKLKLAPDDVLVIRTPIALTLEHANNLREHLRRILPAGTRTMILDSGMDLAVLTRAEIEKRTA